MRNQQRKRDRGKDIHFKWYALKIQRENKQFGKLLLTYVEPDIPTKWIS